MIRTMLDFAALVVLSAVALGLSYLRRWAA